MAAEFFIEDPNFELPLLKPGVEVAATKDAMRTLAALGNTSIVRVVFMQAENMKPTSLLDFVETADEQFENAAGYCEANVVPHSWGLRNIVGLPHYGRYPQSQHPLIPTGYGLVAEVNVIQDVRSLEPDNRFAVAKGLVEYKRNEGPILWSDRTPSQFVYGRVGQDLEPDKIPPLARI